MEFRVLNESEKRQYREELLEILTINDKNFVPPLSQRSSTTQANLQGSAEKADILPYFNKMMEQNILAMFFEGKLCGFVSYIDNLKADIAAFFDLNGGQEFRPFDVHDHFGVQDKKVRVLFNEILHELEQAGRIMYHKNGTYSAGNNKPLS